MVTDKHKQKLKLKDKEIGSYIQVQKISIEAGWDYTCEIDINSKINCYGLNILSQTDIPAYLKSYFKIESVQVGLSHSCVLYSYWDSTLIKVSKIACWGGTNQFSELNIPSDQMFNIELVTVGDEHTCWKIMFTIQHEIRG